VQYKGFAKGVNEEPQGDEWIEIWASDWNKDYWGFYAYISLKNCMKDIEDIWTLINELNWRDGDVYVELINHSDGLKAFYEKLLEKGYMTDDAVLNPDNWKQIA